MPAIDVVIPCYRYGHMLPVALGSVLSQEGVDVRVLIIDDASDDDSAEAARRLAAGDDRVQVRVNEHNLGCWATYDVGVLGWAEAPYTLLISADDLLTPGSLARSVALMEAHPRVGFVYGNAPSWWDQDPLPEPTTGEATDIVYPGDDWLRRRCARASNTVSTPAVVTRTSIQKQVGGYDARLSHTADLEMWLRFALVGDVGFVSGPDQAFCRDHGKNMSDAFLAGGGIADLEQRRMAFLSALALGAGILPDRDALEQQVRRRIAGEALLHASRAYDAGRARPDEAEALIEVARDTVGDVTRLPQWQLLRVRRLIGPHLSPKLRGALAAASGRRLQERRRDRRRDKAGL